MRVRTYPAHTAHLDDLIGVGLLVCPPVSHDVDFASVRTLLDFSDCPVAVRPVLSLHLADFYSAIADLAKEGWEPSEDEDGSLCTVGYANDGREAIGLLKLESIVGVPTIEEEMEALNALMAAAGVRRTTN